MDDDTGTGGLVAGVSFERESGNGGNGGEGLTAKAESAALLEVVDGSELGGSVALEGEKCIVAHHAATVVGNADEAAAAGLDLDTNIGCAGVQRVLEKLFNDGGRTLDNFASRDLIGDGVRKNFDFAHSVRTNTTLGEERTGAAVEGQQITAVLDALGDEGRLGLREGGL